MKITVPTRYLILIAVALFVGTFFLGQSVGRHKADRASTTLIDGLNGQITTYAIQLGNKNSYVKYVEQELLTLKQTQKECEVTNQALKKLNIKTKHTLSLTRDSLNSIQILSQFF